MIGMTIRLRLLSVDHSLDHLWVTPHAPEGGFRRGFQQDQVIAISTVRSHQNSFGTSWAAVTLVRSVVITISCVIVLI